MSDQENDTPKVDFVYKPTAKDLALQTAVPLATMAGMAVAALAALAGIGTVAEKIQARRARKNEKNVTSLHETN
jgi:hypothetical protein